jgi:predicted flap endonuclease-1-like 5' DNA nuclease
MTELWANYWPVVLVAVLIGLITGLLIFRPRQRVTLSRTDQPLRPHMTSAPAPAVASPVADVPSFRREAPSARDNDGRGEGEGEGEGEGIGDEAAAAASDVVGEILAAPVHDNLPGSQSTRDNLQRMKGVGPKLASLLSERGLTRFEQIAALGPQDLERLDADLGAFRGRLARDRVVEQAALLARGDQAAYEAQFGKL